MKKLAALVLSAVIAGALCVQSPVYASGAVTSNDMSQTMDTLETVTSSETISSAISQAETGLKAGFSIAAQSEEEAVVYGLRTFSAGNACGDNLTWTIDDGTLCISGSGAMTDYTVSEEENVISSTAPWFASRAAITSVVIEDGVTSIGECAFYGFSNLTDVSVADSVTELKRGAFHQCTSLTTLQLPESVLCIGEGALSGCTSLTDFTAPGLTEVGEYAFEETDIKEFAVPGSLTTIPETAFYKCGIEKFSVDADNEVFSVLDDVLYCDDGKTLFAFPNGAAKTAFSIPENVTKIGACAFAHNANLQTVSLNNGLETIGANAFLAASALTDILIPDSVKELGTYAFSTCKNLLTVTVGNGIKTISYGCFVNCKNLHQLVLKNGVKEIQKYAFAGCDGLESVTLPESIKNSHPLAFGTDTDVECLNTELENYVGSGYGHYQKVSISVEQYYDKAFEVLQYINEERANASTSDNQLEPLIMQQELLEAAMERASEIAVLFSHTRPNGTRCFTVNDLVYAENVAAGHTTAALVMYGTDDGTTGWMDSSAHRANILSAKAKSVGVGCIEHNGTYYWVQCFGYDDVAVNESCQQPENKTTDQTIMITLDSFGEASNYVEDMYDINAGEYQFEPIIDIDETADQILASVHLVNPGYGFNTAKLSSGKEDAWIRWSSDKEDVAAIDSVSGVVTNGAFGVTNIHAELKYYHPSVPYVTGVQRLAGSTRYETMLEIADALKSVKNIDKFNAAIIATGTGYADALSGNYLASVLNAPILLVDTKNADVVASVTDYIYKNVQEGSKIYILGGEAAVGKEIEPYLKKYEVERLAGDSRYTTNVAILKKAESLGFSSEELLVCTGAGYADSLSASATGRPILLTSPKNAQINMDYVASYGAENIYIIGGTAVVSTQVEKELKKYAEVKRLAGSTRYETTLVVANEFFQAPSAAVLAYAQNFPDGLCGGPLAEAMNAPLILTSTDNAAYAELYAKDAEIISGAVLGGTSLISDNAVKSIFNMDAADTIIDITK